MEIPLWELTWTFPGDQQVTRTVNAKYVQSGENMAMEGVTYDSWLSAESEHSIPVQGTYTNSDASPTNFYLNGTLCS